MKSELFQHEMTETSAIFGRKEKIKVTFGGNGAYTDGSNINLPSIKQDVDISDETQAVFRGYTDHEAGHVKHTDFDEVRRFKENEAKDNKLLFSLANALEDVWLEKKVMNDYPGSQKNLSAVASSVNKAFCTRSDASTIAKNIKAIAPVAITWEGRKGYEGIQFNQECLDLLDEEFRKKLTKWVSKVKDSTCTQDNTKLAQEVYKEIMDDAKQEEEEEGLDVNGTGADEPQGKGDADTDKPRGERETESGSDEEVDKEPETSDHSDGEDNEDQQENSSEDVEGTESDAEDDTEVEVVEISLDEAIEQEAKKVNIKETESGGVSYRPFTTKYDKEVDVKERIFKDRRSTLNEVYADIVKNDLVGSANVIRRKIERALLAKLNRGWDQGREIGRLDNKRLVSAFNGRPNVYKQQEPVPEMDTALQLVIDCSGSMYGERIELAQQVAIALAEAIDKTQVQYEIVGFTSKGKKGSIPDHSPDIYDNWARIGNLHHYIFKPFDERLANRKAELAFIDCVSMSGNDDGESLQWAHFRLSKRPEKRKVMIVLSDGLPATCGWNGDGYRSRHKVHPCYDPMGRAMNGLDHLRFVIDKIAKEGTEIIGIGIQSADVKRFYPNYVVVNNLKDLQKETLNKLAKALLGEKFEIDNSELLKVRHVA